MTIELLRLANVVEDCGWHPENPKSARDWWASHAYNCDPLLAANRSAVSLVLDHEIECEWTGGNRVEDVIIHRGPAITRFGHGTMTLRQPWIWRTSRDRSLLLGPVPNDELRPFRMMDAWIDSARLSYPWFPSIRILEPGRHVLPAGLAIGSIREVVAWPHAPERIERELDERTSVRHERTLAKRNEKERGTDPDRNTLLWRRSVGRRAAVRRTGPWLDVLLAKRWLRADVCKRLIADFTDSGSKWRDGVELWWPDLTVYTDLAEALSDIGEEIEDVTGLPVRSTNPHVVRWTPGSSMPIHLDIGGRHEFPYRRWTSVMFLNTLKEGGHTLIPDRAQKIGPQRGMMVAWPGGHLGHGVDPADEDRYTVICWWTPTLTEGQSWPPKE